ncbi:MAG: hypothetical protein DMG07_25375 [Acidobacteria bacterium]|nr:MAG: hypothetical protein DMG07_25375 [Acidobacteriota bacterium]
MRLLIAGGTVVDGTGRPRQRADLLVERGRIAEIGFFDAPADARRLDAGGLLVAPGFIDIHSHSDFTLLLDPRAVSSITQGVTLEVVGNCGHGCAPIADPELARANIYGASGGQPISWRTMAEYLDRLESARPAVNVVSLAPNGNLRLAAAGAVDRPSTLEELATMTRLLEQALEEGAFGFSTGLEYGPERDCSEEEIVALCRVVARSGGLYATHTRNRAGEPDEAVAEAIRTAADAGARLQISHISVVARLTEDGRGAVELRNHQPERGPPTLGARGRPGRRRRPPEGPAHASRAPRLPEHRHVARARRLEPRRSLRLPRAPRIFGQEHRRDRRERRRRPARRRIRPPARGDPRPACADHHRLHLPRGGRTAGVRAPGLHGRLRCHRARPRRPAGRSLVPRRLHLGRLVFPALRPGDRDPVDRRSGTATDLASGVAPRARGPRRAAARRSGRHCGARPGQVRRARHDVRAEPDRGGDGPHARQRPPRPARRHSHR